jgi:hypothetical protein
MQMPTPAQMHGVFTPNAPPQQLAQFGRPLIDPSMPQQPEQIVQFAYQYPPTPQFQMPMDAGRERAYMQVARGYFGMLSNYGYGGGQQKVAISQSFMRSVSKLSPQSRFDLITELVPMAQTPEDLQLLENLLDSTPSHAMPMTFPHPNLQVPQPMPMPPGGMRPPMVPSMGMGGMSGGMIIDEDIHAREHFDVVHAVPVTEKIIEDCDRPWAMTSDSFYGMFPADWSKEAATIPDFVVNSTSEDLAKKLAQSIGGDGKDFVAACESLLKLENKPMSSPWFETSGGRLRSDIQYTLSSKGETFVRLLRTVKDSTGTEKARELSRVAQRTLEKIDVIMAK